MFNVLCTTHFKFRGHMEFMSIIFFAALLNDPTVKRAKKTNCLVENGEFVGSYYLPKTRFAFKCCAKIELQKK